MSDETTDRDGSVREGASTPSPVRAAKSLLGNAWSSLRTVYYANSLSWRFLKSGALVFFGFFLWAGSNILYSYNPGLTLLYYPMAYGFVLIVYGPLHHLVVLPAALRWRRNGGTRRRLGRHLPNALLVLFVAGVLLLGTFPAGAMTVDFQGTLGSDTSDVDPELSCSKALTDGEAEVTCNLTDTDGVDRVVVRSGSSQLFVQERPPYRFTVRESELQSVQGEKEFTVAIEDENGQMVRRYTRRLSMIERE